MNTINFISSEDKGREQLHSIRKMVVAGTTAVLVIYLIGVAGVFGWWWYKAVQQKKTYANIDSYLTQIKDYANAEAVIGKLNARVNKVGEFLTNRGHASESAFILALAPDVTVTRWDYAVSGTQTVQVKVDGPPEMLAFTKYLAEKYTLVQPDEVGWSVLVGGWYFRVIISGLRHGAS